MTKPVSISNTFAGQTGNIPLSQLDQNFATLQTALNDPATYQNYGADSGTVNAMVVTLNPVPSSLASMIGVPIQVKVNVTNTGAVTLNLNSFGAISVVDLLNTALTAGLLVAGQTVQMIYNGSVFQWQGQVPVAVSANGRLLNIQYFTTAGTATYTPTSGTNSVIVEVVGGGGGSGGAGSSSTSGGAGGTSSFGALISATGGAGGAAYSSSAKSTSGGLGSSGDINLSGGNAYSTNLASAMTVGGSSFYAPATFNITSAVGASYGGGATGVNGTNPSGGGGGGGFARKKITSAFSGVTITVGSGGTAGTGIQAGALGAQGIVIVYEYA